MKNANANVLKFLTVIEADLKEKALYDFSWLRLKWVTGLTPPIINIPSIIANIILRSSLVGWCIALGTNLVTWGINDVFNPIIGKLNQYQTDDLTALKEEVFPVILLCIVDQRIRDFEQGVSNFKKRVSNLEKRIEEMSNEIIIKTQQTLIKKQEKIADLEEKTEKEIRELNFRMKRMEETHKGSMEELREDLKKAQRKDTQEILAAIKDLG